MSHDFNLDLTRRGVLKLGGAFGVTLGLSGLGLMNRLFLERAYGATPSTRRRPLARPTANGST